MRTQIIKDFVNEAKAVKLKLDLVLNNGYYYAIVGDINVKLFPEHSFSHNNKIIKIHNTEYANPIMLLHTSYEKHNIRLLANQQVIEKSCTYDYSGDLGDLYAIRLTTFAVKELVHQIKELTQKKIRYNEVDLSESFGKTIAYHSFYVKPDASKYYIRDLIDATRVLMSDKQLQEASESKYLDMSDISQSKSIKSARIRSGVALVNNSLKIVNNMTYSNNSRNKRVIPFINYMSNKRKIVLRYLNHAMDIIGKEKPVISGLRSSNLPSLNAVVLRMALPNNFLDGVIVSKSMAEKLSAFKKVTKTIKLPENLDQKDIKLFIKSYDGSNIRNMILNNSKQLKEYLVKKLQPFGYYIVDSEMYRDLTINDEGYVTSIDVQTGNRAYIKVTYLKYMPFGIGDKIGDMHSNKAICSQILPDNQMPTVEGEPVDIVTTPEIGKRAIPSVCIEEIMSITTAAPHFIDDYKNIKTWQKQYDIQDMEQQTSSKVPVRFKNKDMEGNIGIRSIVRIDVSASEAFQLHQNQRYNDVGVQDDRNFKYGIEKPILYYQNATKTLRMIKELTDNSVQKEYVKQAVVNLDMVPYRKKFIKSTTRKLPKKYTLITKKLQKELLTEDLNQYIREDDIADTILDTAITNDSPGLYKIPDFVFNYIKGLPEFVVLPQVDIIREAFNSPTILLERYKFLSPTATSLNRFIAEIHSLKYILNNPEYSHRIVDICNTIVLIYKEFIKNITDLVSALISKEYQPRVGGSLYGVAYNDPTLSYDEIAIDPKIIAKLKENPNYCGWLLVARRPVQDIFSITAHKVVPKRVGHALGLNPIVMQAKNGDFDGDAVSCSLVIHPDDIDKLKFSTMSHLYKPTGKLEGVDTDEAIKYLAKLSGYGSSATDLHETDKPSEYYNEVFNGIDLGQVNDAKDFHIMKNNIGLEAAITMSLVYAQYENKDRKLLKSALEYHHIVSQNVFKLKAASDNDSETFASLLVYKPEKLLRILSEYKNKHLLLMINNILEYLQVFADNEKYASIHKLAPIWCGIRRTKSVEDVMTMLKHVKI